MGVPSTGRPVSFEVIDILAVRNGKIVEHRAVTMDTTSETTFPTEASVEPVLIAGSIGELERAVEVFDAAEIQFSTHTGAFIKPFLGGSVYEGVVFIVLAGQADYCRGLLRQKGSVRAA